jgi:hypothetical protein
MVTQTFTDLLNPLCCVRIFLLCTLLIWTGCMSSQPEYRYSDGSGNTYVVTTSLLRYDPITPERSSSGTYSGGEPAEVKLGLDGYKKLAALFEEAIGDRSVQQTDREMMTGLVVRMGGAGEAKIVLRRDVPIKSQLEKKLKELLGK